MIVMVFKFLAVEHKTFNDEFFELMGCLNSKMCTAHGVYSIPN